jgi:tripeptidyl-peptidase-1
MIRHVLQAAALVASATAAFVEPQQLVNGWSVAAPTAAGNVQFTIALVQQNLPEMYRTASEVSDPQHPKYTQYLTGKEIAELTAPTAEDVSAVVGWLNTNNVK